MRELYLIACGLIVGLSVRDWWNRERESIAWDAVEKAEQRRRWQEHRAEERAKETPSA